VHALLSSQLMVVNTHPVAGLQESAVQRLLSLQVIAVPWHTPATHVSVFVQALPSLQAPLTFVWVHPVAGLQESVVHTLLSLQDAELLVNTQPVAGLQESVVQALLSLQTVAVPGWQTPPLQVSPVVHTLPSLQAFVLFVNTHPVAGLQASFVHGLLSLHTVAVPGWQLPPPQASPVVQALPSSQAAVLLVNAHPVSGSQVSVVQALPSLQTVAVPGWQLPPPQMSPVVHTLPSSQAFVLPANTHPVAGLHESSVHGLLSSHTVAVPGWQLPPEHVSPVVQESPSLQAAVLLVNAHPVARLHVSSVQGLPSLQTSPAPGWQLPPPHVSPVVQGLPSSQAFVLSAKTHPVAGLQESSVQRLPSSQKVAVPGWQLPPEHVSPAVQAFPSLQAFVLFVKTHPVAGLQASSVHGLLSSHTVAVPG
jgi:hypothetical protein